MLQLFIFRELRKLQEDHESLLPPLSDLNQSAAHCTSYNGYVRICKAQYIRITALNLAGVDQPLLLMTSPRCLPRVIGLRLFDCDGSCHQVFIFTNFEIQSTQCNSSVKRYYQNYCSSTFQPKDAHCWTLTEASVQRDSHQVLPHQSVLCDSQTAYFLFYCNNNIIESLYIKVRYVTLDCV